jgi:hypothetical protein
MTVVDEYSRFVEAFVMETTTTEAVLRKLYEEVFTRYGWPESIHCDRGPQLMSHEFNEFFELMNIPVTHSSKYNPRGNGQCERYNGELQRVMARILKQEDLDDIDWEEVIAEALAVMRATVCEPTGKSPHNTFFNFKRRVFHGKIFDEQKSVENKIVDVCRGSHVFIRNFLRKKKADPIVSGRGIITDVLTPQLAEVQINGKGTEMINTRHIARDGTDKECAIPSNSGSQVEGEEVGSASRKVRVASGGIASKHDNPKTEIQPGNISENFPLTDSVQSPKQRATRSGRIVKKPDKLNL